MSTVVRWILVPISALGVWAAVTVFGIGAIGLLDALCPEDLMVSGSCTAPWHEPAVEGLFIVGAGIAAFGIVTVSARVAPHRQWLVALATFGAGAVYAGSLARSGNLWGPFAGAAVGGVIGLWWAHARWKRQPGPASSR